MSRFAFALAAAALAAAAPVRAQEHQHTMPAGDSSRPHDMARMTGMMHQQPGAGRTYAWFVSIGAQVHEWGDVATAFNGAGMNDPARSSLAIGGGAYGVRGRFLLGGEGHGFAGQSTASSGGREARMAGGAGFFTVGYLLVNRPMVRAYPLLGIGGTSVSVKLDGTGGTGLGPNQNNPAFGQVLADPGRRSTLMAAGFSLELGGGVDLMPLTRHRADGSTYGLLLGVRAGYQVTPVRSDWRLYDMPVIGGPDAIANGFFVRFSIGGSRHRPAGHRCPCMGQHAGMGEGHQGMACPM